MVIADDQAIIRSGLHKMLQGEPNISVAGEAADGARLLALVREKPPDVLLLDLRMPDVDGMQVIRALQRQKCRTAVVVISQFMNGRLVRELRSAGVLGFLDKDAEKPEVLRAIEETHAGRRYTGMAIRERFADLNEGTVADRPRVELSHRELQVLLLLCENKRNKEIAATLYISRRTVEKIRAKLYEKTGMDSVRSLLLFAIDYGYYKP